MEEKKVNTKISFLYRDANNYKKWNTIVVSGTLTREEITEIVNCLEKGEYFIPEQVGLEAERFGSFTEDDHFGCELSADGFEPTNAPVTCILTAQELLTNFRKAK